MPETLLCNRPTLSCWSTRCSASSVLPAVFFAILLSNQHGVHYESGGPERHLHKKDGLVILLTPAQVQRSAQVFLLQSGIPVATPRPAGKGCGRRAGYRPTPRKRYAIVFKTKKTQPQPMIC